MAFKLRSQGGTFKMMGSTPVRKDKELSEAEKAEIENLKERLDASAEGGTWDYPTLTSSQQDSIVNRIKQIYGYKAEE
jgi:hypothetical protein